MFNLNSKFLKFQNVDDSDFLPIHTPDEPCILNFQKRFVRFNARLSLWFPEKDIPHDGLELVLCRKVQNTDYKKMNNYILFQINEITINLDFVAIQMIETALTEYDMNSVRLCVSIYHLDGSFVRSYPSDLIRNINYDVSEEISVLSIGRNLLKANSHLIELIIVLKRPIPYFPNEIQIQIKAKKQGVLMNKRGFPTDKLYFTPPSGFMVDYQDTDISITCSYFGVKWNTGPCGKDPSIEKLKMKKTISISESEDNEILDTNPSNAAIMETQKTKEICIVICYNKFKQPGKERINGYAEDMNAICSHFRNLYEMKILENETTYDLLTKLNSIIKDDIHKYHQHVVVFVTSHGAQNTFSTFEGDMTFDELVTLFLPENCPQLIEKEKLFFISCCQGAKINNVDINGQVAYSLIKTTDVPIYSGAFVKFCQEEKINNVDINGQVANSLIKTTDVPVHSNVFMGFSTVPGFMSMRGQSGTSYFQRLMKTISEHPKWEVRKIHLEVQKILSKQMCPNSHIPIASEMNSLTKNAYFKHD